MGGRSANKAGYFDKLKGLLEEYNSIFIVTVDNVSSQQMHKIRKSLRGEGVVLMGKNTMVRHKLIRALEQIAHFKIIQRDLAHCFSDRFDGLSRASSATSQNTSVFYLMSKVRFPKYTLCYHSSWDTGNVGFIFTNADLNKTRDVILAEKVAAPARAGAVAPADVFVPAGNTGMEPGKTSFFQALGVPTKIARGTIEITADLKLVEAGNKVGASEATLLNMLNISPFTYGMGISQIYDQGQTFAPAVLDIEEKQLLDALNSAIKTITTISLAANYPTLPSIIHTLVNGYKKVLAVAIETDYSWPGIDELKDRIANPDAYASSAPVAAAEEEKPTAAAEAAPAEEEPAEESGDEGSSPFHKAQKPIRC